MIVFLIRNRIEAEYVDQLGWTLHPKTLHVLMQPCDVHEHCMRTSNKARNHTCNLTFHLWKVAGPQAC